MFLLLHHALPLEVAEDSDDNVEGVKTGFERNVLVEIEDTGNYIDSNPDGPLFEVFMRQCPDADETKGSGEAVGQRYVAVGECHQQPVDGGPDGSDDCQPGEDEATGEMVDTGGTGVRWLGGARYV